MSVEKRQKEQEKTSMVVEGFLFANEAEAAQARKEAEGVDIHFITPLGNESEKLNATSAASPWAGTTG